MLGGATLEGPVIFGGILFLLHLIKLKLRKRLGSGRMGEGKVQLPFGDADEFIPLPEK